MMVRRSLALAAALLAGGALAPPARAADAPLTPLRTLVYDVTFSVQTNNEEQTSGFLRGLGAIAAGSAEVKRSSSADDTGTLTIGVIAATADGGLVTDVTYSGRTAAQETLRVAITRDGRISYDPRRELSIEAQRLLPLLARGFIADRDVSPGSRWSIGGTNGAATYRVTRSDDRSATLAVDQTIDVAGAQGFSENDTGTIVYQTDRLCPLSVDLIIHERHTPAPDQYVSTNARLTASLTRDTFAKPRT